VPDVLETKLKVYVVYLKQFRSHKYCCNSRELEFIFRLGVTLHITVEKVYDTHNHEKDVAVLHLTHLGAMQDPVN